MGFLSGRENYEQIAEKMRRAIQFDRREGGDLLRMAEVGEQIWQQHVPDSKKVGDRCPKCADDTFPCKIIKGFIQDPN